MVGSVGRGSSPCPGRASPFSRDDSCVSGSTPMSNRSVKAIRRSRSQEPTSTIAGTSMSGLQGRSPEKLLQDREFYRSKLPTVIAEFTVIEERLSDPVEQLKVEPFAAQAYRHLLEVLENEVREHLMHCPRCRSQSYFGSLRPQAQSTGLPVKHLASMCQTGQRALAKILSEILFENISSAINEMQSLVEESHMEPDDRNAVEKFISMHSNSQLATFKALREVRQHLFELQKEHEMRKFVVFEINNFQAMKQDIKEVEHKITAQSTVPHQHTSLVPSHMVKSRVSQALRGLGFEVYQLVQEWEQKHQKPLVINGERYLDQFTRPPTPPLDGNAKLALGNNKQPTQWFNGIASAPMDMDDPEWDHAVPREEEPIQVTIRVRPLMDFELTKSKETCVEILPDNRTIHFQPPDVGGKQTKIQQIEFNSCFGSEATQTEVFAQCGIMRLLNLGLNGTTVTVFAYGQTGSGKTHTLSGQQEWMGVQEQDEITGFGDRNIPDIIKDSVAEVRQTLCQGQGVVPRAIKFLYGRIKSLTTRNPTLTYKITASCFEIYNEQVQDLLHPEHTNLAVRQCENGFKVEGLAKRQCPTVDHMLQILMESYKNRKTSPHAMNKDSSRSHAILSIDVVRSDSSCGSSKSSNIMFVDLAGSEQAKKTKQFTSSLIETSNINKSLFALSNCISTLSGKHQHGDSANNQFVQFRDSKLTKILMNSLNGHGLVLLITTISPSRLYCEETTNALFFASKAANIVKKTMAQLTPQEKEVVGLQSELKQYKEKYTQLESYCQYLARLLVGNGIDFQPQYAGQHMDIPPPPLDSPPPSPPPQRSGTS
eukprot:TRINITY_DN65160_c0_g1_i1.p1 TRINITY_DN65160_c0_g1~~TRINITY_DN65160_c0_g1_i1.p1  ORF type:complete len:824 (+),score=67.83 TRINITY_DN65160_c0_g1_i1:75-2546(+)